MKQLGRLLRPVWAAVLFTVSVSGLAQQPAARLAGAIAGNTRTVLPNSRNPRALPANDTGAVAPDTAVNGITLVFSRSAAQEAALQALAAAQGNPASPLYHQWLTPETFAAQFGVADSDIAAVQAWLQSQGFTINGVGRSRDRITFSGTAGQVAAAFGTELHHFKVDSVLHFAPESDISLPVALAPLVSSVQHLSDFRPKPAIRYPSVQPAYTSSQTQSHFLTPADIATMYDIKPEYSAGYNGTGQNIAVAGQSYINTQDVQHFQSAAGLPANLPNFVLVPNSGTSAIFQGDEGESDLDTEYTSGIASGAGIDLVYTGDSPNYGVFDSVTYAVTEDIAPVITLSYGDCELNISTADLNSYNAVAEQATVQGQTLITSSGDSGSTTCYGDTNLSSAQQETPSVDFPASSPYYTGIGGTQMIAGASTAGSTTYWAAANGSDNISSLLSYVPEVVWNEDAPPTATAAGDIAAGGGGTSVVFARPSWQTGVPGIPAGAYRLVPDIALQASTGTPGYLYCSSDPTSFGTGSGQVASCNNGFRDSSTSLLTVAGGTSFTAPIFAGMVAILNQATHATGQGNINVTLYGLASNPTTYASAFHDITSGTNACTAGATFCSAAGASEYAAGTGYDEATGLGSIDFAKLVAAWPATAQSVKTASSIVISLANNNPAAGTTEQVTINVGGGSASPVSPTGTVNVLLDGTVIASALPLSSTGSVTTSFTAPASTGSHVIAAAYSGDSTHASATGSVTFNIGSLTPTGAFTFSAGSITVAANSTGSSTVTVIPSSGYAGTVNFTVTSTLPTNICYGINPIDLDAPPPTGTLTFGTGAACSGAAVRLSTTGSQAITSKGGHAAVRSAPPKPGHGKEIATALAGLLAIGFFTRRRSRLPSLLALGALTLMVSLGLSGCGGSTAPVTPPGGTTSPASYTVTLVGTDSVTSAITSSTTFTLTVN